MENKALLGIVLFPLIGAFVNGLLGRGVAKDWQVSRPTAHLIACMSVAASFLLAVFCFVRLLTLHGAGEESTHAVLSVTLYEWFQIGVHGKTVPVNVSFLMDELSGVMTLVVTGIGLLIHVYSTGYMSEEPSYARFFSYLNLFTASMLILVLGSNLPLMFVGWEGVGLCSYLLIGFWWENPAYAAAGRKAFVANRIGDFGVLLGMFLLVAAVGSFEFADINAAVASLEQPVRLMANLELPAATLLTLATLCLFLGCTGKSAQIPLFVWLPDAMAGPTPVSALIHAATMVTSGLYLICRLSPVFALTPTTMAIIAVIGAATALLAATIGCVQNDIKKVLAYSTVSQLGFMFAGAGCGAFAASFFHVYTHAFFKACLFLGAGSVMHAVGAHGDADIRRLGGLRKYLPKTHWTFFVSCLAIAGVPGLSGFFSKDEILVGALSAGDYLPGSLGTIVFGMLVLAATMTAFYMFRLYFMTFWGEYRGGPEHVHGHGDDHGHAHGDPHESPAAMTIPLMILGVGAIAAGYVWIGILHVLGIGHFEPWVTWLEPSLGSIGAEHHGGGMAVIGGTAAAAAGIYVAFLWYAKPGHPAPARLAASFPGLHAFLMDKWRVDELYEATILGGSRLLATVCAGVDKFVVDGVLAKGSALSVQGLGFLATRVQNGLVQSYAAVMAAGVLGVTIWFAVPHAELEITEQDGSSVSFRVSPGLGYSYAWDFDGDHETDQDFSPETTASHAFEPKDFEEGAVVVIEPVGYAQPLHEKCLAPGKHLVLDPSQLGPNWQREPDVTTPPVLALTEEGVELRPNGARVRRDGKTLPKDDKIVLGRGDHVDIGGARITVAGRARTAVIVRNAFGVQRRVRVEVTVPEVKERPAVEVLRVAKVSP